jgi:hypothetical protein
MLQLKLSTLATGLGLLLALPSAYGVFSPAAFAQAARRFPRYTPIGWVFTLAATLWFLHYVSLETVQDFQPMKRLMFLFFGAVGLGTCVFVRDFLPVRGLAVLFLLCAKLMVDTARAAATDWRLVIVTWAYVWVFAGMWFTISPWRLRDIILWATASEARTRFLNGVRLAFGLFVVALGLTVFRG